MRQLHAHQNPGHKDQYSVSTQINMGNASSKEPTPKTFAQITRHPYKNKQQRQQKCDANMENYSPVRDHTDLLSNSRLTGSGDTTDDADAAAGSAGTIPANLSNEFPENVRPRGHFTQPLSSPGMGGHFESLSPGRITPGFHAQISTEYGRHTDGQQEARRELKMDPNSGAPLRQHTDPADELAYVKRQLALSQAQNKALVAQLELDEARAKIKELHETEPFQVEMERPLRRYSTASNFNSPQWPGKMGSEDERRGSQAFAPRGLERASSVSSNKPGVSNPFRKARDEDVDNNDEESGFDVEPHGPSITDNDSQSRDFGQDENDMTTHGQEMSLFDDGDADARAKPKPRVRIPSLKLRESINKDFEGMSTQPPTKRKRGRGRPIKAPATSPKPKTNNDPETDNLAPLKAANAYMRAAAAGIARQNADEAAAFDIGNNDGNDDDVDMGGQVSKAPLKKKRASKAKKNVLSSSAPETGEPSQPMPKTKLSKQVADQIAKIKAQRAALGVDIETGGPVPSDAPLVNTKNGADSPLPSIEEQPHGSCTPRGRARTPRSHSPPTTKESEKRKSKPFIDGTEPVVTHQKKKVKSSPRSRAATIAEKAMEDIIMGGIVPCASKRRISMSSRPATPAMNMSATPRESMGPATPPGLAAHYNAFFPQKQNPYAGATNNVDAVRGMADRQALQSGGSQIHNLISQRKDSMSGSMRQALRQQVDKETKMHRHDLTTFGAVMKDANYEAGKINTSSLKVREPQPQGQSQGDMGKGGYTYPSFDADFASMWLSNGAVPIPDLSGNSTFGGSATTPKLSLSLNTPYTRTPGLGGTPVLGGAPTPVAASPRLGFPNEPKKVAFSSPDSYAGLLQRCLSSVRGHTLSVADIYEWFEGNTDKPSKTVPNGYKKTIRDALRKAGMFQIISGDESGPNPANEWRLKKEFIIKGLGPDGTGMVDTHDQPIVLRRDESLETNLYSCISRMPERCLPLVDIYAYFQVFVPECFLGLWEEEWKKQIWEQLNDSDVSASEADDEHIQHLMEDHTNKYQAFYLEERNRNIWAIHPNAIPEQADASQPDPIKHAKPTTKMLPKPSQAENHTNIVGDGFPCRYQGIANPFTFAAMNRTVSPGLKDTRGADQYYTNRISNQSLAYSHLKPMDGKQGAANQQSPQSSQRSQMGERLPSGQVLIGQMRDASAQILQIEQNKQILDNDPSSAGGGKRERFGMGPQSPYGQGDVDAGGDFMMSGGLNADSSMNPYGKNDGTGMRDEGVHSQGAMRSGDLASNSTDAEALGGDGTWQTDNPDPGAFPGPDTTFDLPDIQLSVDANDDIGHFIDKYVGNYQPIDQGNGHGGNQDLDDILFGNGSNSVRPKQGGHPSAMQTESMSQGAQLPHAGTSGFGILVPSNPMLGAGVGQSIAEAAGPVSGSGVGARHNGNLSKQQMLIEIAPVAMTNVGPVRVSPSLLDAQLPNHFHGEGGNNTVLSALEFNDSSTISNASGAVAAGASYTNTSSAIGVAYPDLDPNISAALQDPGAMIFADNDLCAHVAPVLMLTDQGGYHYGQNFTYHDEPYFDFLGNYKGPSELDEMVMRTPAQMIPNAEWSIVDLLDHSAWEGKPCANVDAAIRSGGAVAGRVGDVGLVGVMGGGVGRESASGVVGDIQMIGGNAGDKETGAVAPVSSMPGARLYPVFPASNSPINLTAKRIPNPYQPGTYNHILQDGINNAHPDLGSLLPQKDQEILDAMSLEQMDEWYSSNLTLQAWAATNLPLLSFAPGTNLGGGGDFVAMRYLEIRMDIEEPALAEMQAGIDQDIAGGRLPADFAERGADSIKIASSVPGPLPTLEEALTGASALVGGDLVDFVEHKFDKPSGGEQAGGKHDDGGTVSANAMVQRDGGGFKDLDDGARKGAEGQLSACLTGAFDYDRFNGLDFGDDA